ncbi:MAG TPA: 6-bladed beta-propeller [Terriglobia bacterium]|nr:6-bladed beta-propeller [Terriglobia bacterium]
MHRVQSNSRVARKRWVILALAVATVVSGIPSQSKTKKNKRSGEQIAGPPTVTFDASKIVWPSPPEIPRVKFQGILLGQKIDWAALKTPAKPHRSWMDRLAGIQPDQQIRNFQQKIGFQLMRPYGVAVDSDGNIYVADQGVGAIFIFPESLTGPVHLIKNRIDAPLPMICGLAIDDDGRIFVTDDKLHHVLVLDKQHQPIAEFGAGVLISPAGIAIDKENRLLYVVDTQQDQVLVFDADSYKLLRRIGTAGKNHTLTSPGNFSLPVGVAVDKDGNVYVTDTLNDRVEIFDADGNFISQFGTPGDGPGHFARPKGIAIDSDGHIWVTDEVQSRVQVFNKKGQLLIFLGELGWYPGQFQALYGIASDPRDNRIITTEQFPGRVQVFRYVTDAEAAALREKQEKTQGSGAKPTGSSEDSNKDAGQHIAAAKNSAAN